MTSAIDVTKPVSGTPTTASVRANFNAAKTEIEALQSGSTRLNINTTNTQPTTDYIHNQIVSAVSYTANGTGGDTLGLVSYMAVNAAGFNIPDTASQHTSAIYGNGFMNSAGTVFQVNGIMGVSGNTGSGTLTNAVDFFGHADYKTGGGTISNHYFLYQEPSSLATKEYGAYFSAPIGIGTVSPTYALHINCAGGANVPYSNGLLVDMSADGSLYVTRTGMYLYPAYNPGAGGFGCVDLIVGYNGGAETTASTRAFLYITSCPGTPTGVPPLAAIGRCAMRYDTTANKLWIHNGTTWRGVVLT